jgi:hypothetical protein
MLLDGGDGGEHPGISFEGVLVRRAWALMSV